MNRFRLVALGGLILACGCADGSREPSLDMEAWLSRPAAPGAAPKVLFVGVDGLRPDAIDVADAPLLQALMMGGASTYAGTTHLGPSTSSGPGWGSILTGVSPAVHGVDGNDDLMDLDHVAHPTFVGAVGSGGFVPRVSVGWPGFASLVEPAYIEDGFAGSWGISAAGVALLAVEYAAEAETDLIALHFDEPDGAGHESGYGPQNPAYLEAVETVDDALADVVRAILERPTVDAERWLVVLVTDHGGEGTDHGTPSTLTRTIPIAFAGGGVIPANIDGASQMDVLPSILTFMGVEVNPSGSNEGVSRLP